MKSKLIVILISIFAVSAVGVTVPIVLSNKHEHSYEIVKYDESQHWKECECGAKSDIASHSYDNDCDTTCNGCGNTRTITHNYEIKSDATNHWQECTVCGDKKVATAHTYESGICTGCGDIENMVLYYDSESQSYIVAEARKITAAIVSIPAVYDDGVNGSHPVTSIGSTAFQSCSGLISLTIPNSVTSIDRYAFCDCIRLTSVTIPNSVTSIGSSAFGGCARLVEVYNLSSLNITVGSLDNGNIAQCAKDVYTSLDSPSKLSTDSDGYIIYTDGDNKILIDYTGTETNLTLPTDITEIHQYAFYCTGLTCITIPNSVTSIGNYAFYYSTGLTSITIPNNVTSIGDSAFGSCKGLTSVTIPNSVTSIGDSAFFNCTGLTSVYYKGSESDWSDMTIGSRNNNYFTDAARYYYIEEENDVPNDGGNYWHYDNEGNIVVWRKSTEE